VRPNREGAAAGPGAAAGQDTTTGEGAAVHGAVVGEEAATGGVDAGGGAVMGSRWGEDLIWPSEHGCAAQGAHEAAPSSW
jgi:hypothetical protein